MSISSDKKIWRTSTRGFYIIYKFRTNAHYSPSLDQQSPRTFWENWRRSDRKNYRGVERIPIPVQKSRRSSFRRSKFRFVQLKHTRISFQFANIIALLGSKATVAQALRWLRNLEVECRDIENALYSQKHAFNFKYLRRLKEAFKVHIWFLRIWETRWRQPVH